MKAILIRETGGPEVLQLGEVEIGKPQAGQILIHLKAIGVNFVDIYFRRGSYQDKLPFIPGREGAGIVEAVGEGVQTVKVGDRVAFTGEPGAYAEKIIIPADRAIQYPEEFSFEQAAAFPLQGMTAHYLLHDYYTIKPGDVVLIHAAAGGMGLLLVQWAKKLGARVIGTVSTEEKREAALAAGAAEVILYTKHDFAKETLRLTKGKGAKLIIDGVGKATFQGDLAAASLSGHIVVYGAASGPCEPISPNSFMSRSLSVSGGSLQNFINTREMLVMRATDVIKGIQAGWLKLKIGHVLPLSQANEAHRLLENRQTIGKIILTT